MRPAVCARLQARHQKEVHDLNGPIGQAYPDRAARRCDSQKFWMFHGQTSTLAQVDIKRLKGPSLVHLSQLFNRHTLSLTLARASVKELAAICGREVALRSTSNAITVGWAL